MERFNSNEGDLEWAKGSFEDGAYARIDGHSINTAPSASVIGEFAHKSWRAGWCDADAGINANGLADQMKEHMTEERRALCSELGRKAALAKLAKKHARDTLAADALAADALKYFVPAMLLLVEVEADGVLSEQLERKVKQICNNFYGDVRPSVETTPSETLAKHDSEVAAKTLEDAAEAVRNPSYEDIETPYARLRRMASELRMSDQFRQTGKMVVPNVEVRGAALLQRPS